MKNLYLVILMALPLFTFGQELVTVNTQQVSELQGFKMYPNPAYGDEIYITTSSNGTKSVKIFDVFGDVFEQKKNL